MCGMMNLNTRSELGCEGGRQNVAVRIYLLFNRSLHSMRHGKNFVDLLVIHGMECLDEVGSGLMATGQLRCKLHYCSSFSIGEPI
jgi:hypothetical protein